MLATARRAIPFPDPARTDRPDIPAHLGYLAAALDLDMLYAQGNNAARLARAHQASGGLVFYESDTGLFFYDDGAAWRQIGINAAQVHLYNTHASIPAANSVNTGTVYYESDTGIAYRSDGTNWLPVSARAGAEIDYAPMTGDASAVSVTTEGTASQIIASNSKTYDGNKIKVAFMIPALTSAGSLSILRFVLFRDASVVGQFSSISNPSGGVGAYQSGHYFEAFDTPSTGAHIYKVSGYLQSGSNAVTPKAGAGGSGALVNGFIRTSYA